MKRYTEMKLVNGKYVPVGTRPTAKKSAKKTVKKTSGKKRKARKKSGSAKKKSKDLKFDYARKGATTQVRTGTNVQGESATAAAYVGHGTNMIELRNCIARAIVRALFSKAGFEITDFSTAVNTVFNITTLRPRFCRVTGKLQYNESTSSVATFVAQADMLLSDSVEVLTNAVVSNMATTMNGLVNANNIDKVIWVSAHLYLLDDEGEDGTVPLATLNMRDVTLYIDYYSQLSIQNQTLADVDDTVALRFDKHAINASHLIGKHYHSKGWMSYFPLKAQPQNVTTFQNEPMAPLPNTGFIVGFPSLTSDSGFKLLPPKWQLSAVKADKADLKAGGTTVSKWKFQTKLNVNTMMQKYGKYFFSTSVGNFTEKQLLKFGFSRLYGFTKRSVGNGTERPIILQSTLEQTIKVGVKNKLQRVNNTTVVGTI